MSDERIIVETANGGIAVIVPADGFTAQICIEKGDVPEDAIQHKVVQTEDVPSDRTFRSAWVWDGRKKNKMRESVTKSKEICHNRRRCKRNEEFKPLDIKATIPAEAAEAEEGRKKVRKKHNRIQLDIDACSSPEELKAIITVEGI